MWVDGEERSVYGQGHPKDSDFVQWAEECVEELEARERVNPTGPTRSRKERKEMVHEVALKFSDEYFIKVLTGKYGNIYRAWKVPAIRNSPSESVCIKVLAGKYGNIYCAWKVLAMRNSARKLV